MCSVSASITVPVRSEGHGDRLLRLLRLLLSRYRHLGALQVLDDSPQGSTTPVVGHARKVGAEPVSGTSLSNHTARCLRPRASKPSFVRRARS